MENKRISGFMKIEKEIGSSGRPLQKGEVSLDSGGKRIYLRFGREALLFDHGQLEKYNLSYLYGPWKIYRIVDKQNEQG